MVNRVLASRRDRTAIASSIALHLCVLAVLAALPGPTFPINDPDERALLVSITRIERQPTPSPTPARLGRAAAPMVSQLATAPPLHVAVAVAHATRRMVVASERRYVPPAPPDAHANVSIAGPSFSTGRRSVALVETPATPVPTPLVTPTPAPVAAASHEDGIGNFSETYPASVEPGARSTLLAGVTGVLARITVDENGRAIAVEFIRAPADASLRDELRARLLAVRFIPAACNGLRCGGTVELRN